MEVVLSGSDVDMPHAAAQCHKAFVCVVSVLMPVHYVFDGIVMPEGIRDHASFTVLRFGIVFVP